jgi:hypothetical protein
MITTPKWVGLLAVAFVAGSFVASPELRAYAANTVFSTDIVDGQVMTADLGNNAVTAAKVKDGDIKAAEIAANAVGASEIAPDAVGASEIQGVTKLIFAQCVLSATEKDTSVAPNSDLIKNCNISGVDTDDTAVATLNFVGISCFEIVRAIPQDTNVVTLHIHNYCGQAAKTGEFAKPIGIIVFDK